MNRRQFIKRNGLWVAGGVLGFPHIIRAAHPASGFKQIKQAAAGGGSCATSDTVLAHDEMLFGWETGDDPTTWTGPTNIFDIDAMTFDAAYNTSALTTGKPAGACDTGLRMTYVSAAGYDTMRFDRGSIIAAGTAVDVRFYVYVQTILSGVSRANMCIAGQNVDPTGGISFTVEWRDDGGGTIEARGDGLTSSAWITVTPNSWNLFHVHVDATNTSSTFNVNAGTPQTFSTSATAGVRYLYFGASGGAGAAGQLVVDLVAVNTP